MRRLIGLLVLVELSRTVTRRYNQQLREEAQLAAAAYIELFRGCCDSCPPSEPAP